ncbi:7-cyano-7-deazaguanine reductase [Solidesulfovibrio carbinoliphilus subsp. oakridgensis]|uniref:NADPH-dependent 7-cyano-7-deazaguanine reductase n=1 Tax=Solidesulfovibrio carbinoliphilus subsp. oakridgensis TaxID=694327 RepID=G7QC32_9BACT|nr:preQ(1) synthase [Solidesulfovibrio carbinoliphilus]EHJ49478.1 7-cyano-7-deazaguanine reductase [Solidesulfovibrio carbinoliphilus subsp. oakridgensis]
MSAPKAPSAPKDDVSTLTTLGQGATAYPRTVTPGLLETFPNAFPGRRYTVTFASEEFTSLCPKTGQPDFGMITIRYVPDERCIESKSLKLYLFSYRDEGTFMETLTNRILDDLVAACQPLEMEVTGDFAARGGITISVTAGYVKE